MSITERLSIGDRFKKVTDLVSGTSSPKKADEKYVVCTVCDIGCQLRASVDEDGKLDKVRQHDNPALAKHICYKGTAAPHIHNHKDRLTVPLKRVGERGEDKWEEVSYEQAMDEIAVKLSAIVKEHGPESFAVSTSGWNTQTTNGMDRRFMNLLGSPNFISGMCEQHCCGQQDGLWLDALR
jgi:anaerobic selenocysteine-containing dehydrogenase